MPVNMKKTDRQPELQVIRKFEMIASVHPLHHMNAPLTHDIIGDEGGLYSLHVKVKGLEYGIVHIFLAVEEFIFHPAYTERYENSRFSLLKVNNRIRYKRPVNACCGTNSSRLEVPAMLVYIIYRTVIMAC
jgi:hypothetical protein